MLYIASLGIILFLELKPLDKLEKTIFSRSQKEQYVTYSEEESLKNKNSKFKDTGMVKVNINKVRMKSRVFEM